MLRKFRFYLVGLIPGLIIVFFILNQKGASCSGYLPNSRVLMQLQSMPIRFTPQTQATAARLGISENKLKTEILAKGLVDFDKSNVKAPCPEYHIQSPEKSPVYQLRIVRCEKEATVTELRSVAK